MANREAVIRDKENRLHAIESLEQADMVGGGITTDGIIPAGTLIPTNDGTAEGVLLWDANLARNPNGTIVTHGAIRKDKLPTPPGFDIEIAGVLAHLRCALRHILKSSASRRASVRAMRCAIWV